MAAGAPLPDPVTASVLHTHAATQRSVGAAQIAMTVGCVKDEERFGGRVEASCLDNGTFYTEACGPRGGSFLTDAQWRQQYVRHREFDAGRVQHFAAQFEQLAKDSAGSNEGGVAQRIADAWFKRDVALQEDQAAKFYRLVCKQMRVEGYTDMGPSHAQHAEATMPYLVGAFLYDSCKWDKGFQLCSSPFAMSTISNWQEFKNCFYDHPKCRRDRELCLGNCGGNASHVKQDFMTYATKIELSQRVLGTDKIAAGRANCSIKTHTFDVSLFDAVGSEWIAYSSRLRVRGGFTGAPSASLAS